jgi:hypothetical protein
MLLERDIASLRARAKRLRELADTYRTPMSDRLRGMAAELEALANQAEERAAKEEVRHSSETLH